MKKILLTNSNCSWNKGSAAQVISTSKIIRRIEKNSNITLLSHFPENDYKFCNCHNVNIINSNILNNMAIKLFFYSTCFFLIKIGLRRLISFNNLIKAYSDSDIIIDLSGDTFSDVGAFSLEITLSLLFASAFNKPLIIYSQSIGPFNLFASLARRAIDKADVIVVREKITETYLKDLGVTSPIKIAPDCAFVLEPSNKERVSEIFSDEKIKINWKESLVGISANGLTGDDNYIAVMAKVVDHITKVLGAQVIFVPHVLARDEKHTDDDRKIGARIYNLLKNNEKVSLINGDYSPNDLKGIIKSCDMFIGGRMHANIAALSTNVPTIATSWSHKYQGIMDTFGLGDYVCNIRNICFEDIKSKINKLWENRENVRIDLEIKMGEQKEMTWESGKYIFDF